MRSITRAGTKLMVCGAVAIAALTWASHASATVSCDGSWADDRNQSSPTITFPNSGAYSPAEILVNSGQTVIWRGNSAADTFQAYPLVDASGKLWGTFSVNEQSWPFTYRQAGAWEYYDKNNSTMAGIVCVEEPPIASFTHTPSQAQPNQTMMFDASASHSAASFASITDYQWDLGSGTFTDSGTMDKISHAFTKAGVYRVRLKVTDSLGTSSIQAEQVAIGAVITKAPTLTSKTLTETSQGTVVLSIRNPNAVLADGNATLTGGSSLRTRIGSKAFTDPAGNIVKVTIPLSSVAKTYLKHHTSLTAKANVVLSRNGTSKSGTWTVTIAHA